MNRRLGLVPQSAQHPSVGVDRMKGSNSAAVWGCISAVLVALIGGFFTLAAADKLPTPWSLSRPTANSAPPANPPAPNPPAPNPPAPNPPPPGTGVTISLSVASGPPGTRLTISG